MGEKDYSDREFLEAYNTIKKYITSGKLMQNNRITVLVNGQPGSGKSNYERNLSKSNVIIDTDEFRRFHPRIDSIRKLDAENYSERTQEFASRITEKLVDELSKENYNLVIEGTMRTVEVPVNTCNKLKENGHEVNLVVVACDACNAWESTIRRADEMIANHQKPRLVPIDKYDYNVQHIAENLGEICRLNCFDSISIVTRDGNPIDLNGKNPEEVLKDIINIDKWNNSKKQYEREYLKDKIKIIQQEIKSRGL